MATDREGRNFWDEVIEPSVAPARNLELLEDVLHWIAMNLTPSDVFSEDTLRQWAEENGYSKES